MTDNSVLHKTNYNSTVDFLDFGGVYFGELKLKAKKPGLPSKVYPGFLKQKHHEQTLPGLLKIFNKKINRHRKC